MLDLQHIKTEHKTLIERYIPDFCKKMCDFCFGNLYAWSAAEHTEFAEKDGFLYLLKRVVDNILALLYNINTLIELGAK